MRMEHNIAVFLTEEETYLAIEHYAREKAACMGRCLDGFVVDDADSTCREGKGAYLFFVREKKEESK